MSRKISLLQRVAQSARQTLEQNANATPDITFRDFPRGACGGTAHLIGRYLIEAFDLEALYVEGNRRTGVGSHAWISVDGIIVDITADQFGEDPVIVVPKGESVWHQQWIAEPAKPPICSEHDWPMYPISTWHALVEGLTSDGLPRIDPTDI